MRTPFRASALQIPAKLPDVSAAEDGAIVWDRALGAPAVSRSGAFVRLAVQVGVPATATSSGAAGDFAVDATHLYLCVATNTWRRAALAAW